jgi:hypothetical protein
MKEKCEGCNYLSTSKTFCLLGRLPRNCDSRRARRGDEDLIERLRKLVPKELKVASK